MPRPIAIIRMSIREKLSVIGAPRPTENVLPDNRTHTHTHTYRSQWSSCSRDVVSVLTSRSRDGLET